MKPDTILTLGDFAFSRFEIPEKIAFGGTQHVVKHEMVGGARVVDAMGRSDMPLTWSGLFQGESALSRARYLDTLRVNGGALLLSWSELRYRVVISDFRAEFQRFYQIPYSITCEVVEDLTVPVTTIANPGIDELIGADMNSALNLGSDIGDSPLSLALGTLNTAIKGVSSFAKATTSTINGVLGPLAAVQSRVKVLIASTGNVIRNVGTVGGILPNTPIARQAAKLQAQVGAMTQSPKLYNLQSVLGRMGTNLGTIGTGTKTVTTAGGSLYKISQQQYGDASQWPTLAKANGMTDPQISGVKTITVPSVPNSSGGVLTP